MTAEQEEPGIPKDLEEVFSYIDAHQDDYIELLRQAVSIRSVSSEPNSEINKMAFWLAELWRYIGTTVEICDIVEGNNKDETFGNSCPPVLRGAIGRNTSKRTVLFYSHYDVAPADIDDGWDSEPFVLAIRGTRLYGRGVSDSKGPCIMWHCAIEAWLRVKNDIPVNFKFLIEGTAGNRQRTSTDEFILQQKHFFENIDFVCSSDTPWLTQHTPSLCYGTRGLVCFSIDIECCKIDLHSGAQGGTIFEAMPDLVYMLDNLTDEHGDITIPGFNNDVVPITREEENSYADIDFNVHVYKKQLGCHRLFTENKASVLMCKWRYPSLTIHGIEGAFSGIGLKCVIPKKVSGKFSIRTVLNQTIGKIIELVTEYFDEKWKLRNSSNKYQLRVFLYGGDPWITSYNNDNYKSAAKAQKIVYGVDPSFVRYGGTHPYLDKLKEIAPESICLLPLTSTDNGAQTKNEQCDINNYIGGIKVVAAYLYELSKLKKSSSEQKK